MSRANWGGRVLWATGIFTALAIAAGVWVIDSPAQQRLMRLDDNRIQGLQQLDRAVRNYHSSHDALPPDVSTLTAQPEVDLDLADPDGGPDFSYTPLDADHYQLCARFATRSTDGRRRFIDDAWAHPVGDHCFRRSAKDED